MFSVEKIKLKTKVMNDFRNCSKTIIGSFIGKTNKSLCKKIEKQKSYPMIF